MDCPIEIIAALVGRLHYLEKDRLETMSSLRALCYVVFAENGSLVQKYRDQKNVYDQTLATGYHDLDRIYDELTRVLKRPDPLEKDEQEQLRRMLEDFQGPKQ
jgi:hypothetical protein